MSDQNCNCAGVDWGSTSFRAYLFDARAQLVDTISTDDGIKSTPVTQFETTLFKHIGHWLHPGSRVILSGMITSRHGWLETPYVHLPANLSDLLAQAESVYTQDIELLFMPGLSQSCPRADVIRGEELQLFGAAQNARRAMVVMPGTHSKWAIVRDGSVTAFQTIVTGELFDAMLNHTLVGQLAVGNTINKAVFTGAVRRGFESGVLVSELFQSRSGVLLGELKAEHVYSYLSGLLIGNEIREAVQIFPLQHDDRSDDGSIDNPILLVGSDKLCNYYQLAFDILQINCARCHSHTISDAFAKLLIAKAASQK